MTAPPPATEFYVLDLVAEHILQRLGALEFACGGSRRATLALAGLVDLGPAWAGRRTALHLHAFTQAHHSRWVTRG